MEYRGLYAVSAVRSTYTVLDVVESSPGVEPIASSFAQSVTSNAKSSEGSSGSKFIKSSQIVDTSGSVGIEAEAMAAKYLTIACLQLPVSSANVVEFIGSPNPAMGVFSHMINVSGSFHFPQTSLPAPFVRNA